MVDLASYGRVVDVLLDTFPLSAGVVAVEMAACGVPVVSMDGGDADRDLARQRDARVLARDEERYRGLVELIASDAGFRALCREGALELGKRFLQVDDVIGPIEDGIAKAIASVTARAARTSPVGGE